MPFLRISCGQPASCNGGSHGGNASIDDDDPSDDDGSWDGGHALFGIWVLGSPLTSELLGSGATNSCGCSEDS